MKLPATLLALTLTALALPQEKAKPQDPIVTDRPDFTESNSVVPLRWLQIETGFTLAWPRGGTTLGLPETLFRYGHAQNAEFRLGIPDYNRVKAGGITETGFGDVYAGMKLQLSNGFALIPALNLPTHTPFSSGSLDPELKLCWASDLTPEISIAMMAYGLWTTTDGKREYIHQQTLSLGKPLTETTSAFLEYAATASKSTRPDHVLHAGLVFRVGQNRQFDIHAGLSVATPNRQPFLAAGYSLRF